MPMRQSHKGIFFTSLDNYNYSAWTKSLYTSVRRMAVMITSYKIHCRNFMNSAPQIVLLDSKGHKDNRNIELHSCPSLYWLLGGKQENTTDSRNLKVTKYSILCTLGSIWGRDKYSCCASHWSETLTLILHTCCWLDRGFQHFMFFLCNS